MRVHSSAGLAVIALSAFALPGTASAPATPAHVSCADLASTEWSGFRVDSAFVTQAADGQPAHCRVAGTIDDEIHFVLLMPRPDAWNGRFVMGGGGGFVGSVQNQALMYHPSLLADGFATAGTDTGHRGTELDASWALRRLDREIDFGHRAVHLTAEASRTIMRIHYGRDIGYSYWIGCSRGGGQGLVESQRFPDDFDGIVAGAPAFDWTATGAYFIQVQQKMYPGGPDAAPVVSEATRQRLASEVLRACDEGDGLADGLISDPLGCDFDPRDLPRCVDGRSESCFTDAEIGAIEKVYDGAFIENRRVYPGLPYGTEFEWGPWVSGARDLLAPGMPSLQFQFGTQMYKYLVYDDPDWDYTSYDFYGWRADTREAERILNATDTDLSAFQVGGGKLILWHGWGDAALSAVSTIQYYEGVRRRHPDAAGFARLFLLPGMGHCAGGPGPDQVDWLGAIQAWVEEDRPPSRLIATRRGEEGEVELSRPICAYPERARYDGTGDPARAESFSCAPR